MRKLRDMLLFAAITASRGTAAPAALEICPEVVLRADQPITFTALEKELVCDAAGGGPFSRIPYWQRVYFLRVFLQARGYFFLSFRQAGTSAIVATGPLVTVKKIILYRDPLQLGARRYWQIYGKPLTGKLLSDLEKMILHDYARSGFPCARAHIQAYPAEGTITVAVSSGDKMVFPAVEASPIPGLAPGLERRYDAFHIGEDFDPQLLELTARRMIEDQLVLTATLTSRCTRTGLSVRQDLVTGRPNTVQLGVGFDTEEFLIGEAGLRNGRLLASGSSFESFAHASYRLLLLRSGFNWYYASSAARHYLKTSLSFKRQNEKNYDSRSTEFKSGPYFYGDTQKLALNLWPAAVLRRVNVVRGSGPGVTRSLALALAASAMTHDFEYYALDPRSGYSWNLDLAGESKGLGSQVSMGSFVLSATHLWNLFSLEPPRTILGLRAKLAATIPGADTTNEEIPTNLKVRLGGSTNVRGFARESIPPEGAMLMGYLGGELRLNHLLPFGLQPLVFVDIGKIGDTPADLAATTYLSPGWGLHWQMPVGVVRGSMAYGWVSGRQHALWRHRESWQFYLSLGEQF